MSQGVLSFYCCRETPSTRQLKKHLFEGLLRVSESESKTIMVEEDRHSAGAIGESLYDLQARNTHAHALTCIHRHTHKYTYTHKEFGGGRENHTTN